MGEDIFLALVFNARRPFGKSYMFLSPPLGRVLKGEGGRHFHRDGSVADYGKRLRRASLCGAFGVGRSWPTPQGLQDFTGGSPLRWKFEGGNWKDPNLGIINCLGGPPEAFFSGAPGP